MFQLILLILLAIETFLGPVSTIRRKRVIKCKIHACYPRKPKTAPSLQEQFSGSRLSLLSVLPPSIRQIQRQTNLFSSDLHSSAQICDQNGNQEAKFRFHYSFLILDIYWSSSLSLYWNSIIYSPALHF